MQGVAVGGSERQVLGGGGKMTRDLDRLQDREHPHFISTVFWLIYFVGSQKFAIFKTEKFRNPKS